MDYYFPGRLAVKRGASDAPLCYVLSRSHLHTYTYRGGRCCPVAFVRAHRTILCCLSRGRGLRRRLGRKNSILISRRSEWRSPHCATGPLRSPPEAANRAVCIRVALARSHSLWIWWIYGSNKREGHHWSRVPLLRGPPSSKPSHLNISMFALLFTFLISPNIYTVLRST